MIRVQFDSNCKKPTEHLSRDKYESTGPRKGIGYHHSEPHPAFLCISCRSHDSASNIYSRAEVSTADPVKHSRGDSKGETEWKANEYNCCRPRAEAGITVLAI